VEITAPTQATFEVGESVTFVASANDDEDGNLTSSIVWTRGQTQLGTGGSITLSNLPAGSHTVTATVTDSGNLTASDSITVTITEGNDPPSGIQLSAVGRKVKGVRHADLSWTGATTSTVDILRDGVVVATTANDQAHTDVIPGKGGGSFAYQVCAAGSTTTCSNTVIVVF
jgi:hypothetical protein